MASVFVLTFTDWTRNQRWGDRPFAPAVSLELAKAEAVDVAAHSLGDMAVDDWSVVEDDWGTLWVAPVVDTARRQVGVFEIREFQLREG
jgi:hypothetical protein